MASKKARIIKYRVVVRKIELCTDSFQKARIICGMKNCTVPPKIEEFAQDFAESVLGVSIFFDETEARLTKMFRFFQKKTLTQGGCALARPRGAPCRGTRSPHLKALRCIHIHVGKARFRFKCHSFLRKSVPRKKLKRSYFCSVCEAQHRRGGALEVEEVHVREALRPPLLVPREAQVLDLPRCPSSHARKSPRDRIFPRYSVRFPRSNIILESSELFPKYVY